MSILNIIFKCLAWPFYIVRNVNRIFMATIVPSVAVLLSFCLISPTISMVSEKSGFLLLVGIIILVMLIACTIYALLLLHIKYKLYMRLKRNLYKHGFEKRLVIVMQDTWCDRRLTVQAVADCGYEKQALDILCSPRNNESTRPRA